MPPIYYPGDSVSVQVPNIQYGKDLEIAYDSVRKQYYISRLGKPFKLLNIAIQEGDWIKQLNGIPMKQFDDLDEIKDCVNKGGLIQAVRHKNRRHSRRPSTQLVIERANSNDKLRLSRLSYSNHDVQTFNADLLSSSSHHSLSSSSHHSRFHGVCPGTFMRLYNLKAQSDKNGLIVEIIEEDKYSNGRWMVKLANESNNHQISINEANLQPINSSPPQPPSSQQRKSNAISTRNTNAATRSLNRRTPKPDHVSGGISKGSAHRNISSRGISSGSAHRGNSPPKKRISKPDHLRGTSGGSAYRNNSPPNQRISKPDHLRGISGGSAYRNNSPPNQRISKPDHLRGISGGSAYRNNSPPNQRISKPDHLRGISDGSNGSIRGRRMRIKDFNRKYDGKEVRVLQPISRDGVWEVKIQNTEQRIDIPRKFLVNIPTPIQ